MPIEKTPSFYEFPLTLQESAILRTRIPLGHLKEYRQDLHYSQGTEEFCFDFLVSSSMQMWTSGRMSNAKNLFGLGISLYFWGLMDLATTVLSGSARPLTERQEDNLSDKLHQRMKRSWVWNQFFVLEEYTGTDPLYVGKVRPTSGGYLAERIDLCICRLQ